MSKQGTLYFPFRLVNIHLKHIQIIPDFNSFCIDYFIDEFKFFRLFNLTNKTISNRILSPINSMVGKDGFILSKQSHKMQILWSIQRISFFCYFRFAVTNILTRPECDMFISFICNTILHAMCIFIFNTFFAKVFPFFLKQFHFIYPPQ